MIHADTWGWNGGPAYPWSRTGIQVTTARGNGVRKLERKPQWQSREELYVPSHDRAKELKHDIMGNEARQPGRTSQAGHNQTCNQSEAKDPGPDPYMIEPGTSEGSDQANFSVA